MRVMLIYPYHSFLRRKDIFIRYTRYRQPLDIAYCASMLEREGFDVRILDANILRMSNSGVINEVKKYQPDVIFITTEIMDSWQCPFPTYDETADISRGIKSLGGFIKTGIMGPHGSTRPVEIMEKTMAEFVVMGEPEMTVVDVCSRLRKDKSISDVPGTAISLRKRIKINRQRPFIKNLDDIPLPAYHLLPMKKYYHNILNKGNFSIVITSRGCPFQCTFCLKDMWGSVYRKRSVENVMEELRLLYKKYGVRSVYFQDLEFLLDRKRVMEICKRMVKERLDFIWGCTARVDSVDREMINAMKSAGCKFILFGVESINPVVLKNIKKAIIPRQVKEAVDLCKEVGIEASLNTMLGLPGQIKESYTEGIMEMMSWKPHRVTTGITIVFPGTEMYEQARKQGLVKRDNDTWENCLEFSGLVGNRFSKKELREIYKKTLSNLRRDWMLKEFGRIFFRSVFLSIEHGKQFSN